MATAGFSCEYCSAWFRIKIGLGVHKQSEHREEYQSEIIIPKSKTRWSQEELAIMGMHEAILISQETTVEINFELLPLFPSRTREAIKGQRRQQKYKDLGIEYSQRNPSSGRSVVEVPVHHLSPPAEVPDVLDPDTAARPFYPGAAREIRAPLAPPVTVPEVPVTLRRTTCSQVRRLEMENSEVQDPLPSVPLSPVAASASTVSSPSDNSCDSDFVLPFRESPDPDDYPTEDPSIDDDPSSLIRTIREIRCDLDATILWSYRPMNFPDWSHQRN
ncbi:hypothetical protein AVEN_246872-1 [Araneus ventricosus]|uniref:C2H2-type domain-containing protein n=1 Tax=Araneus ventricosus TaxID=182803 RepID=A0A4Y2KYH4_ARAVE|nr:hypothetical protein AVEN_246872-1 [Araneus ventricosus]